MPPPMWGTGKRTRRSTPKTWSGWIKFSPSVEEDGVQPIVAFRPTDTRCIREAYSRIEAEMRALDPDVRFYNWSEELESIGLTPTTDLYDGGHLNQDGAAVFSPWLGDLLVEEAGLTPRPQSENNADAWA